MRVTPLFLPYDCVIGSSLFELPPGTILNPSLEHLSETHRGGDGVKTAMLMIL